MAHASEARFLALHGLRLKGFAEAPAIAAATGLDEAVVADELAKLDVDGLAVHRDGARLAGWSLTRDGRAEQERLAQGEVAANGAADRIRAAYAQFLELNGEFKLLCTDWQLRDGAIYDHGDAAYNEAIFDRLREIDGGLGEVLAALSGVLDRYEPYAGRFAGALSGLLGGDLDLLTKPIIDSYHTIWFELHEDLITSLGIDRSQEGSF